MPDLTIEYRWVCAPYAEWMRSRVAEDLDTEAPVCTWDQMHDGGEPVDGRCPKCGGPITGMGYGV